ANRRVPSCCQVGREAFQSSWPMDHHFRTLFVHVSLRPTAYSAAEWMYFSLRERRLPPRVDPDQHAVFPDQTVGCARANTGDFRLDQRDAPDHSWCQSPESGAALACSPAQTLNALDHRRIERETI